MKAQKKIVIIGPESTGKSTLTETLARHYKMPFVKEYARDYVAKLQRNYEKEDLLKIAQGQIKLEEEQLITNSHFLFCDTDLYVIKVWSEHKYNHCATWILQQIAARAYDLYLLTDIDMPWEEDPQREYPDPVMRTYFYKIYQDIVVHSGTRWVNVKGDPGQRLQLSIEAISEHLY